MPIPSSLTNLIPSDDMQGLMRRIEALESAARGVPALVQEMVGPQITKITDAQADLVTQAAYQASLISRDAAVSTFNTGTLTADSTYRLIGSQAIVSSLAVPTGKMRVTISCSEASIAPGGNSVIALICYAVDGVSSLDPTVRFARLYSAGLQIGSSLARIGTETVSPGTYTLRAQAGYWAAGSGTSSINFSGLRLLAEVIGSD